MLVAIVLAALLGREISRGVHYGAFAHDQPECRVTVQPGESIQAAVDAAQSGSEIRIAVGTFHEHLVIEKDLRLIGAGSEETVIDGGDEGTVVKIEAGRVTLSGIKVTGSGSAGRDGGIRIEGESVTTITDSIIEGNRGDGIVLWGSAQAQITDNLIRGNERAGISSSSAGLVAGSNNTMMENGVDLVGNLPSNLRVPLMEPTEQEIRLPDPAYPTLQHAVDALLPGGRLVLGEGSYPGGITIEKDLTIKAEDGMKPRIEGGYSVISLIGAARVEVIGILLTGAGGWSGLASGATAQAVITDSTISGNSGNGIVLRGNSLAVITDSTISGNSKDGIVLIDNALAVITDSTIEDNEKDGIFLWGTAWAQITGSTIQGHRWSGIYLSDTTRAQITANFIRGNDGAGIASWSAGSVTGSDNTMTENGVDLVGNLLSNLRVPLMEPTEQEIRLPSPAYPTLQHAVDALLPGGRLVLAEGTYTGGVTIASDLTIEAKEGTKPRIEGGYAVISLVGAARLKMSGLLLTGGRSGLVSGATAQVVITDSTISRNSTAISLLGTAQAEITDSTVSENSWGGIVLSDSAQAVITDSTVSENPWAGIDLRDNTLVVITDSTIEYNEEDGIFLWGTAQAQVTGSTIQGHRLSGIVLLDNAQVVITGSTISENGDGIVVVDSAQAAIDGNEIINNRDYGVALYQQPCNDTDEVFTGHVTGRANSIPGPDEPDGNRKGAICPTPKLDFLITEEGGDYP